MDPFGNQVFDHEGDDSARYQPQQVAFLDDFWDQFLIMKMMILLGYQPQQGGLETFLDHYGDQICDHEGDDSARYQPHQGGLETLFGSFWGSGF